MRRNALGSLVAAAGVVLACTCFAAPAQAVQVSSAEGFMSALSGTDDTITLEDNVTLNQGVTITRDVTIDGAGHTLTNENGSTANGIENALNVSGNGVNVTIKNLTIVDTHTGNVLTALEGAQVDLQGVTLDHTQSSDGAALIVNDGSDVKMSGCSIKLGSGSWGGVAMENKGSTVDLGTPTVSGDAGKALVYVDGDTSADIRDYVADVTGSYIVSPITDGQNKPALVSSEWTVSNQAEFQLALDNAPDGMLIRLGDDIEVTGNGLYAGNKKDIILEGNNHTITTSDLVEGSHGGADRAALTFANCENTQITNITIVNESGTNNNGLNIYGGSATTGNLTLKHSANGGAAMVVAAGANVTVTGDISATIGANSWGAVNVDVSGGASKLTFDETVHAIFDTTANPDAPVVYIDEDNNTPLANVVSGFDNAGLYLDSDGSAIEAPVVTFNLDGQVLTAVRVSSDGTLNMATVNEALEAQRPAHKVFDGWYLDAACTRPFEGVEEGTDIMELYAGWRELEGFVSDDEGHILACTSGLAVVDGLLALPGIPACTGIEAGALADVADQITEIYIPANIRYIAPGALDGLPNLMYIEVEAGNPDYYSENGILYTAGGEIVGCPVWYTGE